MLIGTEHPIRLAMILIQHFQHLQGRIPVRLVTGNFLPHGRGLHGHPVVYAVRSRPNIRTLSLIGKSEVCELRFPVMSLIVHLASEF